MRKLTPSPKMLKVITVIVLFIATYLLSDYLIPVFPIVFWTMIGIGIDRILQLEMEILVYRGCDAEDVRRIRESHGIRSEGEGSGVGELSLIERRGS